MKKIILFLTLLIMSTTLFAQKDLKILIPKIGNTLTISDQDRKDYEKVKKIFEKLYDTKEITKDDLTIKQKKLLERADELADMNIIGGVGCSWYCGGGPHKVTASSELTPHKGFTYSAKNAHDLDAYTAWIESKSDYGIGEYLEYFFLPNSPPVTTVEILNGYIKNEKSWLYNSRVKKIKMYIDNEPYAILTLIDTIAMQSFDLNDTLQSTTKGKDLVMKFEILEVYQGEKYKDVAITEINFDGFGVHCFAKGTMIKMADLSEKPIENITIGDNILAFNSKKNSKLSAIVLKTSRLYHHNLVQLTIDEKIEITLTKDHPVMTANKGWASLQPDLTEYYENIDIALLLEPGDTVRIFKNNEIIEGILTNIKNIEGCSETYTILDLTDGDSFFANGILVGTESTMKIITKK